jgi:hypothetical protein
MAELWDDPWRLYDPLRDVPGLRTREELRVQVVTSCAACRREGRAERIRRSAVGRRLGLCGPDCACGRNAV